MAKRLFGSIYSHRGIFTRFKSKAVYFIAYYADEKLIYLTNI